MVEVSRRSQIRQAASSRRKPKRVPARQCSTRHRVLAIEQKRRRPACVRCHGVDGKEGSFEPVGGWVQRHAETRIVAATHRDLEAMVREGTFREAFAGADDGARPLDAALAELERRLVRDAMSAANGNQSEAARRLGISRVGLIKKLTRLGLR